MLVRVVLKTIPTMRKSWKRVLATCWTVLTLWRAAM